MPEAPVKTPIKSPSKSPSPDPERHVRRVCPEQTRRWLNPFIIAPD